MYIVHLIEKIFKFYEERRNKRRQKPVISGKGKYPVQNFLAEEVTMDLQSHILPSYLFLIRCKSPGKKKILNIQRVHTSVNNPGAFHMYILRLTNNNRKQT